MTHIPDKIAKAIEAERIASLEADVAWHSELEYILARANKDLRKRVASLEAEIERLNGLINAPEIRDFSIAIAREAAHQRERWGTEHDDGKTPSDWLWLVAFLATKATQAERYGDTEKYLHHIITTAAALCNWYSYASGTNTRMKTGAPDATAAEALATHITPTQGMK